MDKLEQKKIFKGKKTYIIEGDGKLKVSFASLKKNWEENVSLYEVSPDYITQSERPLKYLVFAILLFLPSVAFIKPLLNDVNLVMLSWLLIFMSPSLLLLFLFYMKTIDNIIFKYRQDGTAAIVMWKSVPSNDEFQEFLDTLNSAIRKCRIHPDASPESRLASYKSALEFLLNENVISETEAVSIFERSKKRILNGDSGNIVSIKK